MVSLAALSRTKNTAYSHPVAVIDIGSNSVRLVIYDALRRTPLPLVNEKTLSGLATNMEHTGCLDPDGVEKALLAMERFSILLKAYGVEKLKVFATSAARDASDGKAFIHEIRKRFGFAVAVIDGDEEARLAAAGVLASLPSAHGIIGDMGGGSLELAYVKKTGIDMLPNDSIIQLESFPFGALRLNTLSKGRPRHVAKIIDDLLRQFRLTQRLKNKTFYAVGGGFRAIAKLHIRKNNYPITVLQDYIADPESLYNLCLSIMKAPQKQLKLVPEFGEDRSASIPFAAAALAHIITIGQPFSIVFSTHGVREGVMFDLLPTSVQTLDPLLSGAADTIRYITPSGDSRWVDFGSTLYEWIGPLFRNETARIKRLRLAACILSHISWQEHTSYRADMAFRSIIDSELVGLSHQERLFIAVCVFHRYQSFPSYPFGEDALAMLDDDMQFRGQVIGTAMRLAYQLSQGASSLLRYAKISITKKNTIELVVKKRYASVVNKSVEKRLTRLGEACNLPTKITMK